MKVSITVYGKHFDIRLEGSGKEFTELLLKAYKGNEYLSRLNPLAKIKRKKEVKDANNG